MEFETREHKTEYYLGYYAREEYELYTEYSLSSHESGTSMYEAWLQGWNDCKDGKELEY